MPPLAEQHGLGDERGLRAASIGCGATFLPPAVTSSSFLRSVIAR